ncbi:flavodoxin-like protein [Georgenia muralis]|uniref:Flavodoxin-like protein n=2 Tax=Georgenia muralis TaxID=154117 RepID=A0A3N4ZQF9_9MICO|nr:flavodoxin-like protein [Georgenia muralis]
MTAPSPSRRTFLHAVLAGSGGATLLAVAGCASPDPAQGPTQSQKPTPMTPTPSGTGTLLVYFSRPGENYWYGERKDLEVGNTEVLATMIADRIECDIYRIEAVEPYSTDYDDTVARNVREQDQDARPAIASPLTDVSGYDILASPIWNVRPPMIMSTFVESVPLDDKRVLPVTTHAMSGLGRAAEVYTELAADATIGGSPCEARKSPTTAPTSTDGCARSRQWRDRPDSPHWVRRPAPA